MIKIDHDSNVGPRGIPGAAGVRTQGNAGQPVCARGAYVGQPVCARGAYTGQPMCTRGAYAGQP
eukprot:128898-Prorocentrum_minimum.AAC.1